MKKFLGLVVPVCMAAGGCVAAGYPIVPASGYPQRPAMGPRLPAFQPAPLPIGRWDNVMLLAVGSRVQVVLADGAIATGTVVSTSSSRLRITVASGDVDLPSADVMRVDRLGAQGAGAVREGAEGAVWGAAGVGLIGLILGRVPPPRLFVAGAMLGAGPRIQLANMQPTETTVYLSPVVVSPAAREIR